MSYTFLLEQGEESSAECFSDIPVSVLSRLNLTEEKSCFKDSETESCRSSRSGMTSEPLTENHGMASLTPCAADSLAKDLAPHTTEHQPQTIYGLKCSGSFRSATLGSYLPKTCRQIRLFQQEEIYEELVFIPVLVRFARQTWVLTTFGNAIGYLHTPTTKANYTASSMQKWPCAREFKRVFGRVSQTIHEWLMGWPIGWTDLKPLATDKFQQWLGSHGKL